MKRVVRTAVSWRFEPVDFFEGPVSFTLALGTVVIDQGSATFAAPDGAGSDARVFLHAATDTVSAVFDARGIRTGRSYSLVHNGFVQVDEDGRQHCTIFPDSVRHVSKVSSPDLIIADPEGTVRVDTRAHRIGSDTAYVDSLAPKLAQSALLRRMTNSFIQSLNDPDNALVHLYEVRDAAVSHFGSDARTLLGISRADWRNLARLANDEPIRQGRHRGRASGVLRDVTEAELIECQQITRRIIDATAALTP